MLCLVLLCISACDLSYSSVGRACLECILSRVRVPPEAAHLSLKMIVLGDLHFVLCCRVSLLNTSCITSVICQSYLQQYGCIQ